MENEVSIEQQRVNAGLSIEQAAKELNIMPRDLIKFEDGSVAYYHFPNIRLRMEELYSRKERDGAE